MSEKRNTTGLITAFLMIIVGLALTPTIQSSTDYITAIDNVDRPGYSAKENATGKILGDNLTRGAARTIVLLLPMFWIILMIVTPVVYIGAWLRG